MYIVVFVYFIIYYPFKCIAYCFEYYKFINYIRVYLAGIIIMRITSIINKGLKIVLLLSAMVRFDRPRNPAAVSKFRVFIFHPSLLSRHSNLDIFLELSSNDVCSSRRPIVQRYSGLAFGRSTLKRSGSFNIST